jgi:hypothetical protein
MLVRPQYKRREQRKHHRHELHPRVTFRLTADGPAIETFCRDISLGGAFLETSMIPLFSTAVIVRIELPGSHDIEVASTVRWSGKDGVGVQFGAMTAHDTYALVGYFHDADEAQMVSAKP